MRRGKPHASESWAVVLDRAARDYAAQVLLDVDAPREHADGARARLAEAPLDLARWRKEIAAVDTMTVRAFQALLAKADDERHVATRTALRAVMMGADRVGGAELVVEPDDASEPDA